MDEPTVTVRGSAEMNKEPDTAVVHVGVDVRGETREEVFRDFNSKANNVRSTLVDSLDLEDEDVVTSEYDFGQGRVQTGSRQEERAFYGTHVFEVTVDNIENVNEVVNTALESGATEIRNISYELSEETRTECIDEAIEVAVQDARRKAEVAASSEGRSLGSIHSIDVQNGNFAPHNLRVPAVNQMKFQDSGGADIQESDVDVNAQVEVVYNLD